MSFPFKCPHCGHVTQVADEYLGKSGPCAGCNATVTIEGAAKPATHVVAVAAGGASALMIVVFMVLGLFVCGGVGVALLLPAVQSAGEAARRTQCSNNLKQVALAMHNYADVHGGFPPAYTVDAEGNKLHSWRTLLLPYLEQDVLYRRIDLNSAWDSPANRQLSQFALPVYCCPSDDQATGPHTNYMTIVGPGTVFEGPDQIGFRDITDGTSNTILVVEVPGSSTNWMEPQDLDLETMSTAINAGSNGMGSNHPGGIMVALADGSVRFIAETIDQGLLRSLITRNDGNVVNIP